MQIILERDKDKTLAESIKRTSSCIDYSNLLLQSIKAEFIKGSIDRYAYERQINLLTVIKLQIEQVHSISKDSISKTRGVYIDVKA